MGMTIEQQRDGQQTMLNERKEMSKARKILCNVLGWHKPNKKIALCGINSKSICKYCGRKIMLDSQGNWFDF